MTSQSSTRVSRPSTSWMDSDNDADRMFRPGIDRVTPDRNVQLMQLRTEQLRGRLDVLRGSGRPIRVGAYARSINGLEQPWSLIAARECARKQGLEVPEHYMCTDCRSLPVIEDRPGWSRIKRAVRGGFLHGVVVLTRGVISQDLDVYAAELDFFTMHSGFISLVHAENVVPE